MKLRKVGSILVSLFILVSCFPVVASNSVGNPVDEQIDPSKLVYKVGSAVVKILTEEGIGSGFIVTRNGYILTSSHVIENKYGFLASEVWVKQGGEKYKTEVIQSDRDSDIALLKIQARDLPFIALGDSDDVRLLDYIIVMGYPFGAFTVTDGKISATRSIDDIGVLQMTAAINPGSSGGPVIDEEGNVIGIVSAKIRPAEAFNFAVAINEAKHLIPGIQGKIYRADSGEVVRIAPGEYQESLVIKKDLTLRGRDKSDVILNGLGSKYPGISIKNNDWTYPEVVIEGVTIKKYSPGIYVGDGVKVSIKDSLIVNNGQYDDYPSEPYGIMIEGSPSVSIKNSSISRNQDSGIKIDNDSGEDASLKMENVTVSDNGEYEAGIILDSTNATIADSIIRGHMDGIFLWNSKVTVKDSTISESPEYGDGIDASECSDCQITLEDSTISKTGKGIYIWGKFYGSGSPHGESVRLTVQGSSIRDNDIGIWARDNLQATIENSDILKNRRGIMALSTYTGGPVSLILKNSTVRLNDIIGLSLDSGADLHPIEAEIINNSISFNRVGIRLSELVNGIEEVLINKNTISSNNGDGIQLDGSSQVSIEANTISKNKGCGIRLEKDTFSGSIQGRSNKIVGNKKGAVWPQELEFLMTKEGGEYSTKD